MRRSNPHKPYLTCWCTLDDVSEENGTVYVLPQYSGEPILNNKDGSVWAMAVPFVKDGKLVYDRAADTFERHAPAYLKRGRS